MVELFANCLSVHAVVVHEVWRLRWDGSFAAVRMRPRLRRHVRPKIDFSPERFMYDSFTANLGYRCAEIQVSYTESRFTDATFHSVSNSSSRSTPRRPIYCTNVISTCWVPIQVLGLLIRPTRSNRRCWSSLDKWHLSVVFTRLSLLNGYSRRVIRRWILGMQEPHNKLPISETNSILVGFGWEFC